MTTNSTDINLRGDSRRSGSPVARVLLCALATIAVAAALPAIGQSYPWPVRPFDQAHPVRGSFGDPRTLFHQGPTRASLYFGEGSFSFHQGIDISAPDGTPVYPVVSGVVSGVSAEWVKVRCGSDVFEYWHLDAAVRAGQQVEARRTVLGRIKRGSGHVHLTDIHDGSVVNPVMSRRLTPYADHTKPWVASIHIRTSVAARDELVGFVRGRLEFLAEAYDTPALPVPGQWNGLPVTPALITWHIERFGGKTVVPETVARDVRRTMPSNSAFWTFYARGSYQNMSVFGKHYSWGQPGSYVFRLAPGGFDTRRLADGLYQLVVTVADTGGNHSSLTQRFAVHNAPGVVGV